MPATYLDRIDSNVVVNRSMVSRSKQAVVYEFNTVLLLLPSSRTWSCLL